MLDGQLVTVFTKNIILLVFSPKIQKLSASKLKSEK